MPLSKGHNLLLTIVDRFTRYPEVVPLQDGSAESVARALIWNWFTRFGIPLRITSDRGGQFESAVFNSLTELFAIKHLRTTPYHPQSNGLVERLHRQLKSSLLCHGPHWFDAIPAVLLGLRCCYKPDIKATPAELVYGESLRLPGEMFVPSDKTLSHSKLLNDLRKHFNSLVAVSTSFHGTRSTFVHKGLNSCTHVFVRDDRVKPSFSSPYQGPFPVLQRNNDKYFTLLVKKRKVTISVDRLKPAYLHRDSETNDIGIESSCTVEVLPHSKVLNTRRVKFHLS